MKQTAFLRCFDYRTTVLASLTMSALWSNKHCPPNCKDQQSYKDLALIVLISVVLISVSCQVFIFCQKKHF